MPHVNLPVILEDEFDVRRPMEAALDELRNGRAVDADELACAFRKRLSRRVGWVEIRERRIRLDIGHQHSGTRRFLRSGLLRCGAGDI